MNGTYDDLLSLYHTSDFRSLSSPPSSGLISLWPEYQTGHAGHKSSIQPEREEDLTPKIRNFKFLTQVESTSFTII